MPTRPTATAPAASARRRLAAVLGLSAVALTALAGACADGPSAPTGGLTPAAQAGRTLVAAPVSVVALVRDEPLANTLTRTWTIRRSGGGTIDWPEVGLKVHVPANAFSAREMKISVTALKGDVVAYDFGPDGSSFAVPLTVVQSLKKTNYYKATTAVTVEGAYFKSAAQIDDATNTATVDEFRTTDIDVTNSQVRFKVDHFSGYMVSMGRKSTR